MCPYKDGVRHVITVETSLDSFICPTCKRPVLISHCLNDKKVGSRKTHGISLHIPYGSPEMPEKVLDFVKEHNMEYNITQLSKELGCSHGKLWYILQGMKEIVIEKKGNRCFVGVRG